MIFKTAPISIPLSVFKSLDSKPSQESIPNDPYRNHPESWKIKYRGTAKESRTSDHPQDLSFDEGDLILITGAEGNGWVNGINTRTRLFGSFRVSSIDIQEQEAVGIAEFLKIMKDVTKKANQAPTEKRPSQEMMTLQEALSQKEVLAYQAKMAITSERRARSASSPVQSSAPAVPDRPSKTPQTIMESSDQFTELPSKSPQITKEPALPPRTRSVTNPTSQNPDSSIIGIPVLPPRSKDMSFKAGEIIIR